MVNVGLGFPTMVVETAAWKCDPHQLQLLSVCRCYLASGLMLQCECETMRRRRTMRSSTMSSSTYFWLGGGSIIYSVIYTREFQAVESEKEKERLPNFLVSSKPFTKLDITIKQMSIPTMEILSDHCACEHREGPHQHASQSGKLESDIENLSPLTTLLPLMITPVSASTIRLKRPSSMPPQCYLLLFTRSLWCLFPVHSRLKCADILSDQLKFFSPLLSHPVRGLIRTFSRNWLHADWPTEKHTRAPPAPSRDPSFPVLFFWLVLFVRTPRGGESCHQVRAWHFDSLPPAHRNSSQAALLPTRDVIAISFRVMHWSTEVSPCKQISCSCTLCDRKGAF